MLRSVYDAKLNDGTLAGQAAEFMTLMSHKVRMHSEVRAAVVGVKDSGDYGLTELVKQTRCWPM